VRRVVNFIEIWDLCVFFKNEGVILEKPFAFQTRNSNPRSVLITQHPASGQAFNLLQTIAVKAQIFLSYETEKSGTYFRI